MKTYFAAMEMGDYGAHEIGKNKIIFADFDIENPACKGDPFVRVGVVDHCPLTDEEYVEFLSTHEVVGRQSEVFPSGICGQDDFFEALMYARNQKKWNDARVEEIKKGNRTE